MPDHQRVVTEVRGILRAGNQTLTDRVRELAEQFMQVCTSAAKRLQRCEEYVFQGRRSEAVQLAQAQPPLLDVLAAINFPERAQWDELTAMYGLAAAPAVDSGRAAAVNTACGEVQPLQVLLREHRRLAMTKVMTQGRLAILRQINSYDKNNPIWPPQIEALEAVRGRELAPEFEQAVRKGNGDKVIAIWTELSQTPWLNPPTQLMESARLWVVQFQQKKARNNLRQISRQLQEAMKGRDIRAARELRKSWDQELTQANADGDDAINAAKPLEWLADMEMLLTKLHEPDLDADDVNYQYSVMDRWQKFLPADLENAYQNRVKQLAEASTRRERIILSVAAVGGGVAVVVFVLLMILFGRK